MVPFVRLGQEVWRVPLGTWSHFKLPEQPHREGLFPFPVPLRLLTPLSEEETSGIPEASALGAASVDPRQRDWAAGTAYHYLGSRSGVLVGYASPVRNPK